MIESLPLPDMVLERELPRRAWRALKELQGARRDRSQDIFERACVLGPDDFLVENYPRKRPLAAFNPGAALIGKELYIFPRLVFDYYSYTSSIGVVKVDVEGALSGDLPRPLKARIIIWPQEPWEAVKGCEDPRVSVDTDFFRVFYTGVGKPLRADEMPKGDQYRTVLGYAELDFSFRVRRKGFLRVGERDGGYISGNKDSAFVEVRGDRATILTRPSFRSSRLQVSQGLMPRKVKLPDMCWRAEVDLGELVILPGSLKPVLVPEPWEYKVGWSTNAVRVGEGEYLVGWHGVLREDLSYRNGLALVDSEGRLKAVSDYVLIPKGLSEQYGDRSLTVFGNGLVVYGDNLIWVGGISDYGIGIFVTCLSEALASLRS